MTQHIAETSIRAYRALTFKQVTCSRRQIPEAVDYRRLYTFRELESLANMRADSVCAHVNELLKSGWTEVPGEQGAGTPEPGLRH